MSQEGVRLTTGADVEEADLAAALDDALETWVRHVMGRLHDQAERVRADYDQAVNARRQEGGRARIGVRARLQTNGHSAPGGFGIEWYRFRFLEPDGGGPKLYRTTYIPRGDGDSYPRGAFKGKMPVWQRQLILYTEAQMAVIRRRVRVITDARAQMRRAMRQLANDGKD